MNDYQVCPRCGIKKIAKKLETDPERIKRDNWIADAKEQHYRKYGERL